MRRRNLETSEMTTYEADEEFYRELSNTVYFRPGGSAHWRPNSSTSPALGEVVADVGATKADLLAAEKVHRAKIAALEARAPVLVYCTACGKGHLGERVALAKFRKCCTTSTAQRKFCRGCRAVLLRTDYVAKYGDGPKGWGTYSKCEQCGTQHRLPVPPPFK